MSVDEFDHWFSSEERYDDFNNMQMSDGMYISSVNGI